MKLSFVEAVPVLLRRQYQTPFGVYTVERAEIRTDGNTNYLCVELCGTDTIKLKLKANPAYLGLTERLLEERLLAKLTLRARAVAQQVRS
jgi:hypothetical protein